MRYDSSASQRTKDYTVDPLRVSYAHGGIYLIASVEEYQRVRTFSVERIRTLAVLDEHFELRPLPTEPFANSIGVHAGTPEPIEIEFDAAAAGYVREREWHPSQEIVEHADGSVLVCLNVCDDRPLRSWILGFGAQAHVVAPARLAQEIFEEIQKASDRYTPRLAFDMVRMTLAESREARLPLRRRRLTAS